jgi:hypothetical protein
MGESPLQAVKSMRAVRKLRRRIGTVGKVESIINGKNFGEGAGSQNSEDRN